MECGREASQAGPGFVAQHLAVEPQSAYQTPGIAAIAPFIELLIALPVVENQLPKLSMQIPVRISPDGAVARQHLSHVIVHDLVDQALLIPEVVVDVRGGDAQHERNVAKTHTVVPMPDQQVRCDAFDLMPRIGACAAGLRRRARER